jgi:DNA-binding transcriptional LysR family regulator
MEMHQVRYFLAVSRTLNFTKAADECHVAQPSLTRAIRQLEDELGGDLFRRERPHAQLTELGQRMLPLLQQCYDSALGARSLASAIKNGEVGALRIALSDTIDTALVLPHIAELERHFSRLEINLLRGNATQVAELMKSGEAELAIASSLDDAWDRLDKWALFTEPFDLIAGSGHRLAALDCVAVADLSGERLLLRSYCEHHEALLDLLRDHCLDLDRAHAVPSERDLAAFIERGLGIAFAPRSMTYPQSLKRTAVNGFELRRTVFLYGVAGRQRTAVANSMVKMLRGTDWSRYAA